jgi:hypothetical protein
MTEVHIHVHNERWSRIEPNEPWWWANTFTYPDQPWSAPYESWHLITGRYAEQQSTSVWGTETRRRYERVCSSRHTTLTTSRELDGQVSRVFALMRMPYGEPPPWGASTCKRCRERWRGAVATMPRIAQDLIR